MAKVMVMVMVTVHRLAAHHRVATLTHHYFQIPGYPQMDGVQQSGSGTMA